MFFTHFTLILSLNSQKTDRFGIIISCVEFHSNFPLIRAGIPKVFIRAGSIYIITMLLIVLLNP